MKQKKREAMQRILDAALALAVLPGGLARLTRIAVASEAGCSEALVSVHFGTMTSFRRDVVREAVRTERLPVIAQALAAGDPAALKAPEDLKQRALQSLAR